jgi:thiamine pyrophosphokinase
MAQVSERKATFVTHLGAGPAPIPLIERALSLAPILVAVDGGVVHAAAAGRLPSRIIGDLDSQPDPLPATFREVPVTRIAEQDSTDFDKALRSTECPLSIGVGFLGGRVDHELACFHSLAAHADRRAVLLSQTDAVTLMPPEGRLVLPLGTRVSLFPLAPVRIRSAGLRWPLADEVLDPLGRIGTSNESTARTVTLSASEPACLVILPACAVEALINFRLNARDWPKKGA